MGLFSSLLGAGVGILGNVLGGREEERGARAAQQASIPPNVVSPLGSTVFSGGVLNAALSPQLQQAFTTATQVGQGALSQLQNQNVGQLEAQRFQQLQSLAFPRESLLRAQARTRLFNRGRLGLGIGGGRTGLAFNPETAALEEALANARLARRESAGAFARAEQSRLLGQATGSLGLAQGLGSGLLGQAGLGVQARTPAGIAGLAARPGFGNASFLSNLFGGFQTQIPQNFSGGTFVDTLFPGGAGNPGR